MAVGRGAHSCGLRPATLPVLGPCPRSWRAGLLDASAGPAARAENRAAHADGRLQAASWWAAPCACLMQATAHMHSQLLRQAQSRSRRTVHTARTGPSPPHSPVGVPQAASSDGQGRKRGERGLGTRKPPHGRGGNPSRARLQGLGPLRRANSTPESLPRTPPAL